MTTPSAAAAREEDPTKKTETSALQQPGEHPVPDETGASVFEALCPLEVIDVSVLLPSQTAELLLAEVDEPHRRLSIPIGLAEATAIAYALGGPQTPKPLTHQLFVNVLAALDAEVAVARITGREGGAFYAEVVVSSTKGLREVPCRPSDAVALALRQRPPAPIVAAAGLLGGAATAPRS